MKKNHINRSEPLFSIIGIELLKMSVTAPELATDSKDYKFNIEIETKADAIKKQIFIIIHVSIKNENEMLLGEISASFIYKADDFEYAVITTTDGNLSIPDSVMDNLNSLSISTMRGIVFTTFKGTFLHNAYLPIIDPTAFRQKQ